MGAAELLETLRESSLTVAVAESLTGGRLASAFVDVPGASESFLGGVVAYDTRLKSSLLGVDAELLAREGAVDPSVAEQMAFGVRRVCAIEGRIADLGLATTGVAGPTEQDGKPVGTVFVAASFGAESRVMKIQLPGDRDEIRAQAVAAALALGAQILARE